VVNRFREVISAGLSFLFRSFAGKAGRILVSLLAEDALHSSSEADAAFAEFVAQTIGGGESLLPALVTAIVEQI
jgi:hypothetical protein